MSTSDESITAQPPPPAAAGPAADDTIPLPPVEKQPDVTEEPGLGRRLAWLDGALWVLVLALAFLLGSFAATNSDLWLHLALGRDLLAGTYHFGVDPYSFTTEGIYWVNHSWFFDVLLYGLYSFLGGAGLVAFKALLVALTAALLASMRRADQSAWLPLFFAALAVLVMSPRLLLQSSVISYLFLALTLFVLVRTSPRDVEAPPPARLSPWWLVPLFVVWANVDHWFWLGPLTVGLFALGELLQQSFPRLGGGKLPEPGRLKTLGLVCGVGLLACVLNPHHVYVFTLPPELAQLVAGLPLPNDFIAGGLAINRFLEYDPQNPLRNYCLSPVSTRYFQLGYPGKTVTGLAYFPLLVLGVASFALSLRVGVLRFWRLLVWAVLALVSLFQFRLVPYFAVAAAPITVLNLQDFAARWTGGDLRVPRGWAISGRLLTGVLLAALVLLAWPGWLNPTGVASTYTAHSPNRVAWRVEEDPSLRQAALALAEMQKSGQLTNGFNYSPEVAHYAIWHVPGHKDFFDYRFALFADQAETVGKIRHDFQEESKTFSPFRPAKEGGTWRRVFPKQKINYVVLSLSTPATPDLLRTYALARRFYLDEKEWVLLYNDGRTVIVGWRGPARADTFDKLPRPLTRDAFAAAFGSTATAGPPRGAQVHSPQRLGTWLDYWSDYWNGQPYPPLSYSEAMQHLVYFNQDAAPFAQAWYDEVFRRHPFQSPWSVSAFLGPTLALGVGAGGGLPLEAGLSSSFFSQILPNGLNDPGPVAHLYLALRKARESLSQDPNDADSYMALVQAYVGLEQVENYWRGQPQTPTEYSLTELRSVQIMAALNFVLELQPDNAEARHMLATRYWNSHLLDAGLEQLTEFRQIVDRRPPQGVTDAKQYEQLQKGVEQLYKAWAGEVSARRSSYLLRAERLDPINKYFAAAIEPFRYQGPKGEQQQDPRGRGLVLEAIKALRAADRGKLKDEKREEVDIQLVGLLLRMGKFQEMAEAPNSKHVLEDTESSPRLQGIYHPAVGDYVKADQALVVLEQRSARDEKAFALLAGETLGNMLLAYQVGENWLPRLLEGYADMYTRFSRQRLLISKVNELRGELKRRADLMMLRGMMALEAGDTDKALVQLRGCLRLTDMGDGLFERRYAEAQFPDRRIALRLVQLLEAQRNK